jgi:hypothetical protein
MQLIMYSYMSRHPSGRGNEYNCLPRHRSWYWCPFRKWGLQAPVTCKYCEDYHELLKDWSPNRKKTYTNCYQPTFILFSFSLIVARYPALGPCLRAALLRVWYPQLLSFVCYIWLSRLHVPFTELFFLYQSRERPLARNNSIFPLQLKRGGDTW